ncbi:MAG: hypothetical protein GX675_01245 [Erysipelotrichaceae bacterium]|nr:hypothetical protein [Erysipelotrichaceae bacterium]
MNLINLGSSSSGNSYFIELEREALPPVKLMLEVGFPLKELHKKCVANNININEIEAFLVTHNHNDHSAAAKDLIKRGKKVYGNSYITGGNPLTTLEHNIKKYIASDTTVIPFKVEHDAPESLGFIIQTSKETILFVNDCKYYKSDLSRIKFDYVFIESNYDGQSIHFAYTNAKENNDHINKKRYERLLNSHMSIKNSVEHLKLLDLSQCKAIFLMHLSDTNSNEHLFIKRVKEATGIKTFACKKNGGLV